MRIGVNIPDDLIKRLGPFRSSVNLSQVCRDAIYAYVNLLEKAREQAEGDDVEQLASGMFERKKTVEIDWELFGLEDARAWASLASDDQWDYLFDMLEDCEERGRSPFERRIRIPRVEGVKTYYDREDEIDIDNGWFDQHIDDEPNPLMVAQSLYQRGFLAYIMIVRQKYREMLDADLKAQKEKIRQMKSELKSNVEIPERLKD